MKFWPIQIQFSSLFITLGLILKKKTKVILSAETAEVLKLTVRVSADIRYKENCLNSGVSSPTRSESYPPTKFQESGDSILCEPVVPMYILQKEN